MEWLLVIRQCFVPATCLTTQRLWWTGRSFGRCAEYPLPSKAVTSWASWSTKKGRSSSATMAPTWACKCAWITRAHSGCSLVYTGLWLSWGFWVSTKWPQTTLELINYTFNYFGILRFCFKDQRPSKNKWILRKYNSFSWRFRIVSSKPD